MELSNSIWEIAFTFSFLVFASGLIVAFLIYRKPRLGSWPSNPR